MLGKRKREQEGRHIIRFMSLAVMVVLLGLGVIATMILLKSSAESESNFLPTAHSLEQQAYENPAFILVNADCLGESQHCFRLQAETLVGRSDGFVFSDMTQRLPSLTLWIDGQQVHSSGFVIGSEIYGDLPIDNLSDGLHLAELSIRDIEENIHQHAWAFRIGSAAGAAVPTLAIPPTHATPTP